MKKLLTGLLVFGSISSFATCNVFVNGSDLDENFSTSFMIKATDLAKESLNKSGYNIVTTKGASDLVLELDITDGGDGSMMGAAVYLYPRGSKYNKIFATSKFSNTFELFNPINHVRSKSRLKKMIKMIPHNDDVKICK